MIWGIGTDIVDTERIAEKIANRPGFVKQVFSEAEILLCQAKTRPSESFAARFAAKEAFLKAIKTGLAATFELNEIEILADQSEAPYLQLSHSMTNLLCNLLKQKEFTLHVSLSHTCKWATAVVVVECPTKI